MSVELQLVSAPDANTNNAEGMMFIAFMVLVPSRGLNPVVTRLVFVDVNHVAEYC